MSEEAPKLPPHSPEAEQGVLGCILLAPNDCLPECIAKFKGNEVFYDLRHQTIYGALVEMHEAREAIDIITLQQQLRDKGLLEQVGGLIYLSSLEDTVPSAANLSYYLSIVQEKYVLRRMLQVCSDIVSRIYSYEGEVEKLMDEVEVDILAVRNSRTTNENKTAKDLVHAAIDQVEKIWMNKGGLTGIATGFYDLDRLTSGLQNGDMIVIAARPSIGKTTLALNIAEHVSINSGLPVGVFSLEMTAESLVFRTLCGRARVSPRNIATLTHGEFQRFHAPAAQIANAPLYIDDSSGLSIMQLRAKARRMHQRHGIKLLVIDYLQLLHSTSKRAENRQQEIADISTGIKRLAKELNVPVIILSQLNRELEKEKNRKPRLADIRESGAIEQDADVVGLLYRAVPEDAALENPDIIPVNLLIAKQRNGPAGDDVELLFHKQHTRFESKSRVEIPQ